MKTGTRSGVLLSLVCALAFSAASFQIRAEETPALNDDGIRALIKDLGSDDFELRQNAEKKLAAQGPKAEALLKAAVETTTDAQVRATAARLLGKLKLRGLGSVDYLGVFPADSVVFVQIRNLAESIEKSKGTAIGKLVLSPALEPFRNKFDAAMAEKPEEKMLFDTWFKRFNGQFGFALWKFHQDPNQIRAAVMLQITDANPQAVFDDFMNTTGLAIQARKGEGYRDVDIYENPQGGGGLVALAGPHIILSINRDSLKIAIDNLLKPGGLAASPAYAKLKPSLGEKPEFLFGVDYMLYMKQVLAVMEVMGQADQAKAMQKAFESMGVELHQLVMATASNSDRYEDRMALTFSGDPKGLMGVSIAPADAPPPLEDAAIIPANAVAAAIGYVDGKTLQTGLKEYLPALLEMSEAQMKGIPPEARRNQPDIKKFLATFEELSGIKFEDSFGGVKGTVGYYAVLAPGGVLQAPDLGMFITFADNEQALKFSDVLRKGLDGANPVAVVREVDAPNNRKFRQIDLRSLGLPVDDKFPYAPVWTVEKNRIFLASSVAALRKQLSYLDTKTPGLLTQADFVKAMGLLKPEERRGQLFYVDMKSLMILGATVGLPFAQASIPDEGLRKALAALPPPAELFKDMPPLLGTTIYKGSLQESVFRGPIPPIPSTLLLAIGAGFWGVRQMQPGGPVPVEPGGF